MKNYLLKYIISAIILGTIVLLWFGVEYKFSQRREYFIIENIELEINKSEHSRYNDGISSYNKDSSNYCANWLVRLKLKKKFVTENYLSLFRFGKSSAYAITSPGGSGLFHKIDNFQFYIKDSLSHDISINNYIRTMRWENIKSCLGIDTIPIKWFLKDDFYKRYSSLDVFVKALNQRDKFTVGDRLDGEDLYFYIENKMDKTISTSDVFFDIKTNNFRKNIKLEKNKKNIVPLYHESSDVE